MALPMEQSTVIYLFCALVVIFILYSLSGAADWVEEQVRAKKLDNDDKELELEERRKNLSKSQ